jgi:probable rRNA maturation factor
VSIAIHWDTEPIFVTAERLREVAGAALEYGGRPGLVLNVILVTERELTRLHGKYLADETPTDVITFDLGDDDGTGGPLGEVYISADCARRTAAERGVSEERELALYLVHGALHLCGLDDHDARERAAMRDAEREVLARLGYTSDSAAHDELLH